MANRDSFPDIGSVPALLALAYRIGRDGESRYLSLAEQMRRLHNDDSARVFDRLAAGQTERVGEIARLARSIGVDVGATPVLDWQPDEDEAVAILMGTDYLMTPYRAFQLAVLHEQQAFTLFSMVSATATDPEVQDHAEELAHQSLETLSLLRADRRLAYRGEPRSALSREGLNDKPATVEQVRAAVTRVDAVLGRVIAECRSGFGPTTPEVTRSTMGSLQDDYPAEPVTAPTAGDPVALLKRVLLEFEAAVELCLRISEMGKTEAVIAAAHEAAERYLGGLSVVRDQLDYLIHLENQQQ
jgi:hypothetical protein